MNNHSVRPTGSMAVPEAHANVAESSRNIKEPVERESGRGKEVPYLKAKERESPKVEPNPRRKKMTIVGKSKVNATDAGQRDIGPISAASPDTWLTFTSRARKGKVNMSPTSSLSQELRSMTI